MSEARDPLEAELSALRPHEISAGLRQRVAERLADSRSAAASPKMGTGTSKTRSQSPFSERRWRLAFAGGLAAACLAAILLWWWGGRRDEPEVVKQPQPAPHVEDEESQPTLLAYQRALARSPEDLDALLDKDALTGSQPNPELMRIRAFTWSHELGDD